MYKLIYLSTNTIVAHNIVKAETVWQLGFGLIGRKSLGAGEGLWLPGITSVHTFGLRFSIDILFLDSDFCTSGLFVDARPGRIFNGDRSAKHCVELESGSLRQFASSPMQSRWILQKIP